MVTYSLRGSMVTGSEKRTFPSTGSSGTSKHSNSSEWALWELSGWGWTGLGLARAFWMRMCRGTGGGWLGGSVVGLGGSACTAGTGPENMTPGGCRDLTLGGDGGTWDGSEGDSVDVGGTVAFVLFSLLSDFETVGGNRTGAEGGSVVEDSGTWLGGVGSAEWCLVTGVILFGGVGGDGLMGAGTTTRLLPGWERSAVNKQNAVNIWASKLNSLTTFTSTGRWHRSHVSFIKKNKPNRKISQLEMLCSSQASGWERGGAHTTRPAIKTTKWFNFMLQMHLEHVSQSKTSEWVKTGAEHVWG